MVCLPSSYIVNESMGSMPSSIQRRELAIVSILAHSGKIDNSSEMKFLTLRPYLTKGDIMLILIEKCKDDTGIFPLRD